jgi:hypothetical protein
MPAMWQRIYTTGLPLKSACNTVEQMGLINTLCRGYYAGVAG